MPAYREARKIGIYASMANREIQTADIIEHALQAGKEVFVPYVHRVTDRDSTPTMSMDMLQLHDLADFRGMQLDKWQIPSLPTEGLEVRKKVFGGHGLTGSCNSDNDHTVLDLILMPGVAFDCHCNRLGHGKGFYDRFLARCRLPSTMPNHEHGMPTLGIMYIPLMSARSDVL